MMSFRLDEADAAAVHQLAERLGVDRSELLRDAVRAHLARLRAESDVEAYRAQPLTEEELAFIDASDWGPPEDWSDWLDAEG